MFRISPARSCLRIHRTLPNRRIFSFTPLRRSVENQKPSEVPSFREEIARTAQVDSFGERVKRPSINNQVLFSIYGTLAAFTAGAWFTNLDTEYWSQKLVKDNPFYQFKEPTSEEIKRAKYLELGKRLQAQLMKLKDSAEGLPLTIKGMIPWAYAKVAQSWLDATEGRRLCWIICGVNGAVWLAWQFPRLKPLMMVRFAHNPLSGLSYTLFTSMFSHASILHLGFNCLALASFGAAASQYLAREQRKSTTIESTVGWHFAAFFISAGLFSGLVSHVVAVRFRFPRLIAQLSKNPSAEIASSASTSAASTATATAAAAAAKPSARILPSLGSSGAIYSAVVMTALAFPEAQVSLFFPPTVPIPIQWGVGGMILLDTIGVIRGWRLFDHYAHLGGAAFGALYYAYGPQWWELIRSIA